MLVLPPGPEPSHGLIFVCITARSGPRQGPKSILIYPRSSSVWYGAGCRPWRARRTTQTSPTLAQSATPPGWASVGQQCSPVTGHPRPADEPVQLHGRGSQSPKTASRAAVPAVADLDTGQADGKATAAKAPSRTSSDMQNHSPPGGSQGQWHRPRGAPRSRRGPRIHRRLSPRARVWPRICGHESPAHACALIQRRALR